MKLPLTTLLVFAIICAGWFVSALLQIFVLGYRLSQAEELVVGIPMGLAVLFALVITGRARL